MWVRLAGNDGKLEIATNKRVSPLAVLAKVRVMEIAASKTKKLQVTVDKWARKSKFEHSSANTNTRSST